MTPRRLALLGLVGAVALSLSGCFAPGYAPVHEEAYEVPVVNGYAWSYDCGVLLQGPYLLLFAFFLASGDVDWDRGKDVIKTIAAPFAVVIALVGGTVLIPATLTLWALDVKAEPSQTKSPAPLEPESRSATPGK